MLYNKYYKPYNWLQSSYFFHKYKKTKYGKTYRLLMILYVIITNIKKINNLYRALKSKKSHKHLKLNWRSINNLVNKKKTLLKKKIFFLKKVKLKKKIKKYLNKKLFNYKYFLLLYLTEMHRYVKYSKIESLINIINHSLYYKKKRKKIDLKNRRIMKKKIFFFIQKKLMSIFYNKKFALKNKIKNIDYDLITLNLFLKNNYKMDLHALNIFYNSLQIKYKSKTFLELFLILEKRLSNFLSTHFFTTNTLDKKKIFVNNINILNPNYILKVGDFIENKTESWNKLSNKWYYFFLFLKINKKNPLNLSILKKVYNILLQSISDVIKNANNIHCNRTMLAKFNKDLQYWKVIEYGVINMLQNLKKNKKIFYDKIKFNVIIIRNIRQNIACKKRNSIYKQIILSRNMKWKLSFLMRYAPLINQARDEFNPNRAVNEGVKNLYYTIVKKKKISVVMIYVNKILEMFKIGWLINLNILNIFFKNKDSVYNILSNNNLVKLKITKTRLSKKKKKDYLKMYLCFLNNKYYKIKSILYYFKRRYVKKFVSEKKKYKNNYIFDKEIIVEEKKIEYYVKKIIKKKDLKNTNKSEFYIKNILFSVKQYLNNYVQSLVCNTSNNIIKKNEVVFIYENNKKKNYQLKSFNIFNINSVESMLNSPISKYLTIKK